MLEGFSFFVFAWSLKIKFHENPKNALRYKFKCHAPSKKKPFFQCNISFFLHFPSHVTPHHKSFSIKNLFRFGIFIKLPLIDVPVIYLAWIQSKVFKNINSYMREFSFSSLMLLYSMGSSWTRTCMWNIKGWNFRSFLLLLPNIQVFPSVKEKRKHYLLIFFGVKKWGPCLQHMYTYKSSSCVLQIVCTYNVAEQHKRHSSGGVAFMM